MAPLAERFRDALHEAGHDLDPGSQNLAVDLVRLLVRTTGGELGGAGRRVVDSALAAQLNLNEEARKILLDLALAPRFRTTIEPPELKAFEAFFGRKAAEVLRGEQTEELGLEGFSVGSHRRMGEWSHSRLAD
jgi:hypothetical protein